MIKRFRDRSAAGRELAEALRSYRGREDVVVLALARGGVPVGYEVARSLGVPLDVFVVRKLGVPSEPELAMGAIATGGVRVLMEDVLDSLSIPDEVVARVAAEEERELERRERRYRGDRAPEEIEGRTVILIDDGLATGATMRAAARAVRAHDPKRLVIAVPVGSPETCASMEAEADEVVCLMTPEPYLAVGFWYEEFGQTTDEEVEALLKRAAGGGRKRAQRPRAQRGPEPRTTGG